MDLTRVDKLPKADVCLMFKLLDTLETQKLNMTRGLLEMLDVKWAVISFPLKTLGGRKPISKKRLAWFEKLINEKEPQIVEIIEIPNEIFYIIKLRQ